MKKKYTMEEFEVIFNNAKIHALKKLDEDFEQATKDEKGIDNLSKFAFSMQNMMAMIELQKEIFGKENK